MANLTSEDIRPVVDLLEQLQNVRRAISDLQDAYSEPGEFSVAITSHQNGMKDAPVAHTHRLPFWFVLQGLAAMERELLSKLRAKEIEVEAAEMEPQP